MIRHAPSIGIGIGISLRSAGVGFNGLANQFPGGAFGVSLRLLNNQFANLGIVGVRRASDSDVVFVKVDKSFAQPRITLNSPLVGSGATFGDFVSGTDGFVPDWIDQSGQGNNATQGDANAQPKIVSAGSLVVGGLDFDGVDDFFAMPSGTYSFANSTNKTLIVVSESTSDIANTKRQFFMGLGGTTRVALWRTSDTGNAVSFNGFANAVSVTFDNTNQFLAYAEDLNGTQNFYINGGNLQTNASGGTNSDVDTAEISNATNVNQDWDGTIAEIIIYESDQSANRVGIETNINDHYSIYA